MIREKNCKILMYLAPGFEEIEAVTIIDLLRRAGLDVTVAGLRAEQVTGSHQITIVPDIFYGDVNPDDYDCLVLPGGQPGSTHLKNDTRVLQTITTYHQENKLIAAICAAPTVLAAADILKNKKVTSYPSEKDVFKSSDYQESTVVTDGMIVTSRGVGTAIEFSLELIRIIKGEAAMKEQAARILWDRERN